MAQQYDDNFYIGAMQCIQDLGATTIRALIKNFGTPYLAWQALSDQDLLSTIDSIGPKKKDFILKGATAATLSNLEKALKQFDITYITYLDDSFPSQLNDIYNPPAVLFAKGTIELLNKTNHHVAMVGARKCSDYAGNVARKFSRDLARHDVVIISGGARGIDSLCHEGALEGNGKTIAVMGCGLNQIYPKENKKLFSSILQFHGLLLSECPPFTPPIGKNFPARNRIISGLSQAVIIVEAKASSGSLITADMGINAGRDVYVIPGNVLSNQAEGNHWLLRQGAHILTKPTDLLDDYGWTKERAIKNSDTNQCSMISFTLEENRLLQALPTDCATTIDDLFIETRLPLTMIQSALVKFEIEQIIRRVGSRGYILCK